MNTVVTRYIEGRAAHITRYIYNGKAVDIYAWSTGTWFNVWRAYRTDDQECTKSAYDADCYGRGLSFLTAQLKAFEVLDVTSDSDERSGVTE